MQIKESIKATRHWPLCWELTGTGEFPAQMASNAENVSISWRHQDAGMPVAHHWRSHVIIYQWDYDALLLKSVTYRHLWPNLRRWGHLKYSRPHDACMLHSNRPSLVQMMPHWLFGTKLSSESVLTYLNTQKNLRWILNQNTFFRERTWFRKCRL